MCKREREREREGGRERERETEKCPNCLEKKNEERKKNNSDE